MPTTTFRNPAGIAHRPAVCRVRFHAPLLGARLAPIAPPVVPSPPAPVAPVAPVSTPAVSVPPSPPSPPIVPVPRDFWATDAGRELLADRARIEAVLAEVHTTAVGYRKDQSARLEDWQRAAVELAMTIAARVLHERLESGDFPIEAKVREMITQLAEDEALTIRLNPDDLKLLNSRLAGEPLSAEHSDLKLVPDEALARGDCRVEGRESMLLSEVTRELQEIRDELLRSLAHARS